MKLSPKYIFLLLSFVLATPFLFSQNKVIDSLNIVIKNDKDDLAKAKHLNALSWEHLLLSNSDSAIAAAERALLIAGALSEGEQLKASAESFSNIAMGNSDKGNFAISITYFLKALKIGEDTGNKKIISNNLANIGNVYGNMGEFDKSLEYIFKAMKISEELGDREKVATDLGNIGNLYDAKNETNKALDYYQRALKMSRELNYKYAIGSNLGNIGLIYSKLGEEEKAITHYMQALIIAKETGDQRSLAINEGNIGELYMQMLKKAKPSEKNDLIKNAESHLLNALAIDTAIQFLHHQENTHHNLSELYAVIGDHKKSLEHFKLYSNTKDSLFNQEKDREITRHEMTYEFEKKEANLKAEQDKKEAVALADKKRQNIFFWLMSIVAIAIAIIAIIVFRSLRITRQQKQIIENQKELVEEKQNEILSSIQYAKRIQESLLPTEKYIDRNMNRLRKK